MTVDRSDVVLTHLRSALHHPAGQWESLLTAALSATQRKKLSDILMMCYVHKILRSKEDIVAIEKEFLSFIRSNNDYDAIAALRRLVAEGQTRYALEVSHARGIIASTLRQTGRCHSSEEVEQLLERGYSSHLRGSLIRCLDRRTQLTVLRADPTGIPQFWQSLLPLLPTLPHSQLELILSFFDPREEGFLTSRQSESGGRDYWEEFLEVLFAYQVLLSQSPAVETTEKEEGVTSVAVTSGWHHSALVTNGRAFLWGRNSQGQLGLGHSQAVLRPSPVPLQRVTHVACGGEHSLWVQENLRIFVSGKGERGQLGTGDFLRRDVPTALPPSTVQGEAIVSLGAGWAHSVVITRAGHSWTVGAGDAGQSGLGHRGDVIRFTRVERLSVRVRSAACGHFHSVFLGDNGDVLTCGNGIYGQLGHSTEKDQLIPKLVEALSGKRVQSIFCGSFHTIALTESSVFSFGRGSMGRLGHGDTGDYFTPTPITALEGARVTSVSCGHCHTVAVTEDHAVYAWGSAERGKLGLGDNQDRSSPTLVTSLLGKSIVGVSCGEEFTLSVTDEGTIYSWGAGQQGVLGHGHTRDLPTPTAMSPLRASSMETHNPSGNVASQYAESSTAVLLRSHGKHFRAAPVLRRATDWHSWWAAAIIYASIPHFPASLRCRFASIASKYSSHSPRDIAKDISSTEDDVPVEVTAECTETLSVASQGLGQGPPEELLLVLFRHWRHRQLPLGPLEEWLIPRVAQGGQVAEAMARLLRRDSGDSLPWQLPLSSAVAVSVLKGALRGASRSGWAEKLWQGIGTNLNKDLLLRSRLTVSSVSFLLSTDTGKETLIFTCNHHFPRHSFFEQILPELKQRLDSLPLSLPVSVRMIVAEYHQQTIALACPSCVFNSILDSLKLTQVSKWQL